MVNVLCICVAIICYCIALLIAVETKNVYYHLRQLFSNATRFLPLVAAAIAIVTLCTSCGSNPDDHTGENWILAIGLLLCWLKGGR